MNLQSVTRRTGFRDRGFKFVAAVGAVICAHVASVASAEIPNGILFIGDGMGPAQVTAARIYQGNARDGKLTLDSLPNTAIVRTYCYDNMVTDSAAAAAALATGVKVKKGAVSVAPEGDQPLETILEKAVKAGKSVGVVTTTTITHATPACFYAHVGSRGEETEIAKQLIDYGKIDVVFGGGRQFFTPKGQADEEDGTPGSRSDGADLIAKAKEIGYTFLRDKKDFDALEARLAKGEDPGKVMGLFSGGMMAYEVERAEDKWGEPSLAEMTRAAIAILSKNPKGYFLMVEGGRIDLACHENRAMAALNDLLAFDAAIKTGIELVDLEKTIILVTADHETGGLAINGYPPIDVKGEEMMKRPPGMGAGDIITFASGPGANREPNKDRSKVDPKYQQPSLAMAPMALHTGVDVHGWGIGAGSEAMRGTIENTDIAKIMMRALGMMNSE